MSAPADTPPEVNLYVQVVTHDADPHATRLTAAWALLRGLLSERAYTVDELIEATGLKRRVVKGLLFHGRKAGKVRAVDTTRQVEAAPDVFVVRTVRGYRAAP